MAFTMRGVSLEDPQLGIIELHWGNGGKLSGHPAAIDQIRRRALLLRTRAVGPPEGGTIGYANHLRSEQSAILLCREAFIVDEFIGIPDYGVRLGE